MEQDIHKKEGFCEVVAASKKELADKETEKML